MKRCLTLLITKDMNIKTTMKHYRFHRHEKIIKEYYEQIYDLKFDNPNEMDKFLERHNVPNLTQGEINNINRPISTKEMNQ